MEGNDAAADDVFAAKNRFLGIGTVRDPHPDLARLQAECPVHAGSISGIFGVVGPDNYLYPDDGQVSVFGFDTVDAAFRDPERFSSSYVAASLSEIVGRTILEMDPPDHHRYRLLLQGAFTKKEMVRWEDDFIRDIVSAALDRIVDAGRGDLAQDFAFHFPIEVTAAAAGLPMDDIDVFYEQAALLTTVAAPEAARSAASRELGAMIQTLIDDRRRNPRGDLVGVLVEALMTDPASGERVRLQDAEIIAFLRLLIPAGAQTTYRAFTNLLYALLTHPDQYAAIVADPGLIPQAVEEGLRWEPPLLSFGRIARIDTEIEGHPVPEGTVVNLCVAGANRDPRRWDHAERFDIFRDPQGHLGFGQGNHVCLGIHLARSELRIALESVVERLPGLRLDPDADDVHIAGLASRTAVSLPCVWDLTRSEPTT